MSDTPEEIQESPVSPLDLSDEEFDKLDIDALYPEEGSTEPEVIEEDPETTVEEEPTDDATIEEEVSEEAEPEEETDSSTESEGEEEVAEKEADTEAEPEKELDVDYKGQIEQLFKPFKANGKEIKIDSVDDAITLMQMGANYNKKMAGLKPSLKILKMLENNSLLDETKLSYLIDLEKKDPDAIKKLIADSGIDPLDINENVGTEYTPKSYTVDDREVDLEGTLEEIQDTASYKETMKIIGTKWDDSSRGVLYNDPSIIKVLNSQVESGVYQQVDAVIQSERMLGRLKGMTDIEAYQHVGKAIEAQGGFSTSPAPVAPVADIPVKKAVDPKLTQRKKAAGTTKSSVAKVKQAFNPLAMSDAEFEKLDINNL